MAEKSLKAVIETVIQSDKAYEVFNDQLERIVFSYIIQIIGHFRVIQVMNPLSFPCKL